MANIILQSVPMAPILLNQGDSLQISYGASVFPGVNSLINCAAGFGIISKHTGSLLQAYTGDGSGIVTIPNPGIVNVVVNVPPKITLTLPPTAANFYDACLMAVKLFFPDGSEQTYALMKLAILPEIVFESAPPAPVVLPPTLTLDFTIPQNSLYAAAIF